MLIKTPAKSPGNVVCDKKLLEPVQMLFIGIVVKEQYTKCFSAVGRKSQKNHNLNVSPENYMEQKPYFYLKFSDFQLHVSIF